MSLPLDGVTVVAIEQAVAAPLATRNLADLGARVIKVERLDGGDLARSYDHVVHGTAAHVVWLNRGKESIAVDLKTSQGATRSTGWWTARTSSCRTWPRALRLGWGWGRSFARPVPSSCWSISPGTELAAPWSSARPTTC